MDKNNLNCLRENLHNYYTNHRHLSQNKIYSVHPSVHCWLCSQNKINRKNRSGRVAKKATPMVIKAIKNNF